MTTSNSGQSSPNFSIQYSSELIPHLKKDHKILLQQLEDITQTIKNGSMDLIPQQLGLFRATMLEHITQENLKLYIYLQYILKNNTEEHAEVRAMKKEMDSILVTILDFLNEYTKPSAEDYSKTQLLADFNQMKSMYITRIDTEENILFPMYKKPL